MDSELEKIIIEFKKMLLFDQKSDHSFLADSKIQYLNEENIVRLTFDYSKHPPKSDRHLREGYFLAKGVGKSIGLNAVKNFNPETEEEFNLLFKDGFIDFKVE